MSGDWEDPHYSVKACNGRGGWLPRENKAGNVIPSYAWFNFSRPERGLSTGIGD